MDYSQDDQPVIMSYNTDPSQGSPSKKKAWLILLAIAVVIAGTVGFFLMNPSAKDEDDTQALISENVADVSIEMTGATPSTVKIKKGQQITFTNRDTRAHRLTADQAIVEGFDSTEDLATGDTYTYVFESAGTFKYYDPVDPQTFNGTVTVE